MLKEARRTFPKQEPVYENEKFVLKSQIALTEGILDAYGSYQQKLAGYPTGSALPAIPKTI